jgi:hypothetical protein
VSNKKKKLKKPSAKPLETLKTFEIVRLDWNDHWSGNHAWFDPAEGLDHKPKLCITVGVVVKEDKDGITVAQNMGTAMQAADTTFIMKSCIVNKKVLGQLTYAKET